MSRTPHARPSLTRRHLITAAIGAAAATQLAACAGAADTAQTASPDGSAAPAAPQAKPAILVTSFGTSYASSRHATIGAIESDIREAYPDWDVRRAFTAQIVIDHIERDTGRHIDNLEEAFDKLVADGVRTVVVQPTHLMAGFEYADIATTVDAYRDRFDAIALGAPLFDADADMDMVAEAVHSAMAGYEGDGVCFCLMGHGTEADSNGVYEMFETRLHDLGYENYFVATVEATPTFADATKAASDAGYTKAVLLPLMVVAGDHATNDMADESNPESFASVLREAGFEVTSLLMGLGQIAEIDEVYVAHVQHAIDSLAGATDQAEEEQR